MDTAKHRTPRDIEIKIEQLKKVNLAMGKAQPNLCYETEMKTG